MVKLSEAKIRWIIHEKLRGRGAGELALIQRVSRRRIEQLWQSYRRTAIIPALKKLGRPSKVAASLREATIVMKAYDDVKVNALSLEHTLKQSYGLNLPHNRIHTILKETGRALNQPAKQARRKWVRYEREHSMSLRHTDWKQLDSGEWWITYEDDASRLITGYGVFKEATAENTIRVLEQAIAKYGCPREILTDRGTQFYASEGERREKAISQFEAYLAEKGIRHILSRVNHPQTNGKLERFYSVYEQKRHQFKSIDEYVHWHNEVKPHLSLNFDTPIKVFHRKLPQRKQKTSPQRHRMRNNYGKLQDRPDSRIAYTQSLITILCTQSYPSKLNQSECYLDTCIQAEYRRRRNECGEAGS